MLDLIILTYKQSLRCLNKGSDHLVLGIGISGVDRVEGLLKSNSDLGFTKCEQTELLFVTEVKFPKFEYKLGRKDDFYSIIKVLSS